MIGYSGYLPPKSFKFDSRKLALAQFAAALCAVECARFYRHSPSANSNPLSLFAPAYALADWAVGKVDSGVYAGKERGAYDGLVVWARSILEFNSFFRSIGIEDPLGEVVRLGLIERQPSGGFRPNIKRFASYLSINLKQERESVKNLYVSG